MKTQNILKGIRLMTFFMVFGLLTFSTYAFNEGEELRKGGDGASERIMEEADKSEVELEDWMMDVNNFTVKGKEKINLDWVYTGNSEEIMSLEDWMMDAERFIVKEEQEMNVIQDWMLDKNKFKVREEDELERIEDWMLDSDFWRIKG